MIHFLRYEYSLDLLDGHFDICLSFSELFNTYSYTLGKIVLHLLIIGVLGYDWDGGSPVGIHPNFMPSQTPTIHP